MLVLTRRMNEAIIINENISIRIIGVSGGNVKLGIDAPKEVPVHREEIYERLRKQGLIYKCPADELFNKEGNESILNLINKASFEELSDNEKEQLKNLINTCLNQNKEK